MNEEEIKKQKEEEEANKLSEIEIAELANKELRKKEQEIADLKKQLAKEKLYSQAEEEEREIPTREDCLKVIGSNKTNNYDYAQAVVDLVDIEKNEGRANPLGKNGDAVYDFFKEVIEECDGDKNLFTSIYQNKLGEDDPQIKLAYNKRKKSL